jgi:hypothetical protein
MKSKPLQTHRISAVAHDGDDQTYPFVVPTVDYVDPPRVRIYDAANDGSFWHRGIGFLSRINEP